MNMSEFREYDDSINNLIKEMTDEWVETFEKPENQDSIMFKIAVETGIFPEGVNPEDKRVIRIIENYNNAENLEIQ